MQRLWREWLTNDVLDRWLHDGRYYHLNLVEGDHENPESRITDDIRLCDRSAGRHRRRHSRGVPLGGDVHLRALVGRRRARFPARRNAISHPRLSRHRRVPLCDVRHRLDAAYRQELRPRVRGPEPARSRIPLRPHPPARERREHRAARRREGGTRGALAQPHGAARKLAPGHGPVDAHDLRLVDVRLRRGGAADPVVRAEIPRRRHDARAGHAGGIRLRHRADRFRAGWSTTIHASPTGTPMRAASRR